MLQWLSWKSFSANQTDLFEVWVKIFLGFFFISRFHRRKNVPSLKRKIEEDESDFRIRKRKRIRSPLPKVKRKSNVSYKIVYKNNLNVEII